MVPRPAIRTMTAVVALTMMACGEHIPDGPDPGDHAPPGVIAAVAQDVNHVVVVFDEQVTRWSADNPGHYHISGLDVSSSSALSIAAMSVSNVFTASLHDDYRTVTLTTAAMLDEPYVITVTGVSDTHGNAIVRRSERSFDGTNVSDTTPPEVVYQAPKSDAAGISTGTFVTAGFSEAVLSDTIFREFRVHGEGARVAGNASAQLFTLTFSTGAALETGGFAGTITGDSRSIRAADPTGGLVFAGITSPNDLYTSVAGIVGANDMYAISHLRNARYFPFYVKDSNGNRLLQPRLGDAIGAYGVSDWFSGDAPRTVDVADAQVTVVDFRSYDPTAVYGLLSYDGPLEGSIRAGLFRTDGFDPTTSAPVVAITADRDGNWDYVINTLDTGPFSDGSYYVGGFLDADGNGLFDPSHDPMGVYGGATPIAVDLSFGKDAPGASFTLYGPTSVVHTDAVGWPNAPRSLLLKQIVEMVSAWSEQ